MKKHLYSFWLLCLVLSFSVSVLSAQSEDSGILVQDLAEIVGGDYRFDKATLAPDGQTIAWIEKEGLCHHNLDTAETSCHPWAWIDNYMKGWTDYNGMYLAWSPNSQFIAIARYSFIQFDDSDIWLFDMATHQFSNKTKDNTYEETGLLESSPTENPPLDYLPTWISPDELIFFRTYPIRDLDRSRELKRFYDGLFIYRLRTDDDEPQLVLDLSEDFTYLVTSASLANHSNVLAILGVHPERGDLGVWLLDMETLDLVQVMSANDLVNDFFTWWSPVQVEAFTFESLMWTADDRGILANLLWLVDIDYNIGFLNTYYIDLETQQTTAVVDFSSIPEPQNSDEATIANFKAKFPRSVFVSHDTNTLYFIPLSNAQAIPLYSFDIPFDSGSPVLLDEINYVRSRAGDLERVHENGRVLVDGRTLITFPAGD